MWKQLFLFNLHIYFQLLAIHLQCAFYWKKLLSGEFLCTRHAKHSRSLYLALLPWTMTRKAVNLLLLISVKKHLFLMQSRLESQGYTLDFNGLRRVYLCLGLHCQSLTGKKIVLGQFVMKSVLKLGLETDVFISLNGSVSPRRINSWSVKSTNLAAMKSDKSTSSLSLRSDLCRDYLALPETLKVGQRCDMMPC